MNKEQLIAKCKEIEPEFKVNVYGRFIEIHSGEYFMATIWKDNEHISIESLYETEFLPVSFPKILTIAQQYFKENE